MSYRIIIYGMVASVLSTLLFIRCVKPSIFTDLSKNVYNFFLFKNEFNPPISAKIDVDLNKLYSSISSDYKNLFPHYSKLNQELFIIKDTQPIKFNLPPEKTSSSIEGSNYIKVPDLIGGLFNFCYNNVNLLIISIGYTITIFFLIKKIWMYRQRLIRVSEIVKRKLEEENKNKLLFLNLIRDSSILNNSILSTQLSNSKSIRDLARELQEQKKEVLRKQINNIRSLSFSDGFNPKLKDSIIDGINFAVKRTAKNCLNRGNRQIADVFLLLKPSLLHYLNTHKEYIKGLSHNAMSNGRRIRENSNYKMIFMLSTAVTLGLFQLKASSIGNVTDSILSLADDVYTSLSDSERKQIIVSHSYMNNSFCKAHDIISILNEKTTRSWRTIESDLSDTILDRSTINSFHRDASVITDTRFNLRIQQVEDTPLFNTSHQNRNNQIQS